MKWEEVRRIYPDKFVKIQILKERIEENVRYIDDMAVIQAFDDNKEATRELVGAKDDIIVYHTSREKIEMVVLSLEKYAELTDDVELKLDEADREADSIDVRYTHDEVISRVRARINAKR